MLSLRQFAAPTGLAISTFLRYQVTGPPGHPNPPSAMAFSGPLAAYIDAGNWDALMPKGVQVWTLA
jgi:hypothetical protein